MPSFSMELTLWKPYLTNEVLSVLIVWSYQNLLQVGLIHLPKTQQLYSQNTLPIVENVRTSYIPSLCFGLTSTSNSFVILSPQYAKLVDE